MRIRARARNVNSNQIFTPDEMAADQLTLLPDGGGFINVNGNSTKLSERYPHLRPEASTLRYDSNGIEVFEFDHVLCADGISGVIVWGQDHAMWQVRYGESLQSFVPLSQYASGSSGAQALSLAVCE